MPVTGKFSIVFDERGEIVEVTTPNGQKLEWKSEAKSLSVEPQTVAGIVVPMEILTTTTGLT